MNNTGKTIAKNASVMLVSQFVTWGLSLLLMIFMPRLLGATAIGQFQLAGSIWTIVGMFANFGMGMMLTKEVARNPTKISDLFGTIVVLRTFLSIIGFGGVAIYANWIGYSAEAISVIYIMGLFNVLSQIGDSYQSVLQGIEHMEYISLASIVSKVFTTVVGLAILFMGYGILTMAFVYVAAELISLSVKAFLTHRLRPIQFQFRWNIVRRIFGNSSPYFLVSIFLVIYMQLDIVIISWLVDEKAIGWYGTADDLFSSSLFIPSIFVSAIFPALTRMHGNEPDSVQRLTRRSFDLLMFLSVPVGLGVLALADPVVVLLFGPEFANSGPILAVMGIVLIFTYQNMLLGYFLISSDRQNAWTVVMAVATAVTIPLDLLLVPWCQNTFGNGAIGGALAFVVTESGMMIAGLALLPKGYLSWTNAWTAVRTLIAGLGMVGAVWMVRDSFIAIPIAVGAVTYLLLILLLRVVPKEDWALLRGLAQSGLNRLKKREPKAVI